MSTNGWINKEDVCVVSLICGIWKKSHRNEARKVIARDWEGWRKPGGVCQRIRDFSYKMHMMWESNIKQSDYSW